MAVSSVLSQVWNEEVKPRSSVPKFHGMDAKAMSFLGQTTKAPPELPTQEAFIMEVRGGVASLCAQALLLVTSDMW